MPSYPVFTRLEMSRVKSSDPTTCQGEKRRNVADSGKLCCTAIESQYLFTGQ